HLREGHEGPARGLHHPLLVLPGRHHGRRVPDQPPRDRRRPLPLPRAPPQARRRRRLPRPRHRHAPLRLFVQGLPFLGDSLLAVSKRLRVGLLLDSFEVPAWVWVAVREIVASGDARLAVVVLNAAPAPRLGGRERLASVLRRGFAAAEGLVDRRIPPDEDAFLI